MKSWISLKMEVNAMRVVGLLAAIPVCFFGSALVSGLALRTLGYDLTRPQDKLRIGMSTKSVREILGEPDTVATLDQANGSSRVDWWYSKNYDMELTFESDRLVTNHSKNQIPQ
jgi:outer membrane protein assembly factor BamE (lipoprotein component of BamABCDE complex)